MSLLISPRDLLLPAGREAALTVEVESRWAPFIDPARSGFVAKTRYDHIRPGWRACILRRSLDMSAERRSSTWIRW